MTIGCYVTIGFIILGAVITDVYICMDSDSSSTKILSTIISLFIIAVTIFGCKWWCTNTASGIRAVTDQKAEFSNGLDRTINVYTANGDLIATYSGKIDLEDNQGGYVLFEFDGKRYTYYNCFVESIANVD